jgi:hypothetical protein
MADHYFAVKPGEAGIRTSAAVTVATSSTSATAIELRITDGQCRAIQVANALRWLADCMTNRNPAVVPDDMFVD